MNKLFAAGMAALLPAALSLLAALPLSSAQAQTPTQAQAQNPSSNPAQPYPSKAIRWVVTYPAGGGSDFLARTIGQQLSTQIHHPVVVDNKPGANTAIGASEVARSAPDGYTVLSADNGTLIFNPVLYSNLIYHPSKDLAPVSLLGRFPMILVVSPGEPATDARAFVARVKGLPDGINFASAGAGSPHHLAMELFRTEAGLKMTHAPYKGAAPALADVAGGQVPAMMVDMAAGAGFITTGKVRPLAVANATRLPQLPDVPTFAELGYPTVVAAALVGMVVPASTPTATITALNQQVVAAIQAPDTNRKLVEFGVQPVGSTPEAFASLIETESARWHKLIRELNIKLD